ncbi:MAG TPA: ABC transporter ATP-binding protein [Armatimonadota bacterium]|nr:ABC transporter ATP-binding protein [Armatimonadota bacterium]
MSQPIIEVHNIGKRYVIGANRERYLSLRDQVASRFSRNRRAPGGDSTRFWALRNVDFEVQRGETFGIIGRNGAGKSTLLKILSQITPPTEGRITMRGRVASLLEVGTGFHPELTGRENVYLNGAILGMTRSEVARKFDEIVAFAEVEKFLDTPVKRYSSGMYVRLAFAVAAHLEPEILVVDEVLSVGDRQFQKKCLGKMGEVAKVGRTVLFVSHNLEAVRKLCTRGMLLESGEVKLVASTEAVLDRYLTNAAEVASVYEIDPPADPDAAGYAYRISIETADGEGAAEIPVGRPWQVRVHFTLSRRIVELRVAVGLFSPGEVPLRTSWSSPVTADAGTYDAVFREDVMMLAPGRYPVVVGLSEDGRAFHYIEDAAAVNIVPISQMSDDGEIFQLSDCGMILNPMNVALRQVSAPLQVDPLNTMPPLSLSGASAGRRG